MTSLKKGKRAYLIAALFGEEFREIFSDMKSSLFVLLYLQKYKFEINHNLFTKIAKRYQFETGHSGFTKIIKRRDLSKS